MDTCGVPESYFNNSNEFIYFRAIFPTTKLGARRNAISTPVQTTIKTCLTKYSEKHAHSYNSINNNKQQMMLTLEKKEKKVLRRRRKQGKKSDSYTDPVECLIIFNPWIWSPL